MAFHPAKATPQPNNSITMPQLNTQQGDVVKANMGTTTPQVGGATSPVMNAARVSMASGGSVPAPPDIIGAQSSDTPSKELMEATKGIPAFKGLPTKDDGSTEKMLNSYKRDERQAYFNKDQGHPQSGGYAKGGEVNPSHEHIKNMPLKDVIKMLASHPGLSQGMDRDNQASPGFAAGGGVMPQTGPGAGYAMGGNVAPKLNITPRGNKAALIPNGNKAPALKKSTHQGTLDSQSNVNVGTYKEGGLLKMAAGGSTGGDANDLESDQIIGYGPDGTPEVKNADGSIGYGDVNSLLGRPKSAPTLGTGQDPHNATSAGAANVAQPTSATPAPQENQMAKGGEEGGAPPGSLSHEVADDVPAHLSEGEFVFSADAVRFWGLRVLNQMMDHARQELAEMNQQGEIRHPGDGQNPDEGGKFMQDAAPNTNAYDKNQMGEDDDDSDGILKECMGGMNYAAGGDVDDEEEQYRDGGDIVDAARGGVISSASTSLAPKKMGNIIPSEKSPITHGPRGPNHTPYGSGKFEPSMKKGGLLQDAMPHQSYVN